MRISVFDGEQAPYINDAFWVRDVVFTQEQGFDADIDHDEYDALATHVVLYDDQQPIATARLIPFPQSGYAKIGRVAVLAAYRQKGLGAKIMNALISAAMLKGISDIRLSSQCHASAFYEKLGFRAQGEVYLEEGVEHIMMHYQK